MPWTHKLLIGVSGGLCLAFLRLVRNALELSITADLLLTALIAAVPLCFISTVVAMIFKSKSRKEVLRNALLAPSILTSFIAGADTPSTSLTAGASGLIGSTPQEINRTVSLRNIFSELFVSTAYAQTLPPDTARVVVDTTPVVKMRAVQKVSKGQLEPGVMTKTLRFLGMSQNETDWIYVIDKQPDSVAANEMLQRIEGLVNVEQMNIHLIQPAGSDQVYIVAGEFGDCDLARKTQEEIKSIVKSRAVLHSDTLAVAAKEKLLTGEVVRGQLLFK